MIVLDTNVGSELARADPAARVVSWLDAHPEPLAITAVTVGELLHGVARLAAGRRRTRLVSVVETLVHDVFAERVLPYDHAAAVEYAAVVTARETAGRPISVADAQIAGTCRSVGARLATRNTRDFVGTDTELLDPWAGAATPIPPAAADRGPTYVPQKVV